MQDAKYKAAADEDGSWSVIDAESEIPAVVNGVPQVGLTEDLAREVADTLNAMMDDGDG
ncbi:hypothetical protein [Lichenifustis flavocetrariae]|uniref:Uncharacterized protein n=1 Tax=Lichenifustis flavocetrariae TaxID=2949735 RepID=A0AA42CM04_9HYPH|nr:hypothetical protein [Lichenifustis flavocetrariae]MCW6507922.1 hypothetical protein [Lichenifustis flavocetrariae]